MKKAQIIISYLYLVMSVFLMYEGCQNFTQKSERSYLLFGLSLLAILMFFLKRRMLKKYR